MGRRGKILVSLAAAAALSLAVFALWPRKEQALCGGRSYPLGAVAGGAAPYVRLSADGVSGEFLLDYGATRSSLSAAAFAGPEGSTRNAALSLAGVPAAPFVLRAYDMPLAPSGGQLGVIGTDILSRLAVQLSKRAAFVGAAPCQTDALRAKGLVPISQSGFFGADPTLNDGHHPNVPVVFVSVGGVRAPAQIDTGYDDVVYTHSVDINQPLFDRLTRAARRSPMSPTSMSQPARAPRTEASTGSQIARLRSKPTRARRSIRIDSFHLILKRANGCGGIAAMTTPAAQLGASFLEVFRTVVFDPGGQTVWLEGPADAR